MQRMLVIRGGAIGDMVVTLPALRALREAFPQMTLELLGHAQRAVLAHHPRYADRVTDMERWELYRLFLPYPTLSEAMRAFLRGFALILSYVPTPDGVFASNLQHYCPGHVQTWSPQPSAGVHITEHLLQPIRRLVPQCYDTQPRVPVPPAAQEAAEHFWHTAGLPAQGVVAFHPGSGGAYKLWPMQGWEHVMHWAAAQGIPGLLIRGPAEQETSASLPAWPCAAHLPLPTLAAILARCQVVVSHDSGVSHLAAAVGTTTLALFGPTSPLVWGPRSPQVCVLWPQPAGPLTDENLPPAVVIRTLAALLTGTFTYLPSPVACTILDPASLR